MNVITNWLSDEHNRATIYRFCLAVIPLLAALDIVTGEIADEILRSVQILLGGGASLLATRNTKRRPRFEPRPVGDDETPLP